MKEETRQQRWRRLHPWMRALEGARRRCACTDPKKWYPYYGAKGVKCTLTSDELEEVWKQCHGWDLARPSLDRKDPNGHYEMGNVRFIEFEKNSRMAWDPTARDAYAEHAPEFY